MAKQKESQLSWDDFQKLGNPDNAPIEVDDSSSNDQNLRKLMAVRLHFEKKGRGGKAAVIIRGIEESDDELKEICKKLKTKLGVGGSFKEGEIIIQGSNRSKMIEILKGMGFLSVKNSGG